MHLMLVVVVLKLSVYETICAEIPKLQKFPEISKKMTMTEELKKRTMTYGKMSHNLSPLLTAMSQVNSTRPDDPLDTDDLERLKRAQGPITELYGCLLTLFLNPACWNRFENNQLRYLQYLYLRRRLQMMEQARRGMNETETRVGKGPLPVPATAGPPPEIPLYARVLMRYFPQLFRKVAGVQMRVQGVQKVVMTQAAQARKVVLMQAAQARGFIQQSAAATAAQAKALVPVVQQRVLATAAQARALILQTLAALAPPPQGQGQMMKPMKS